MNNKPQKDKLAQSENTDQSPQIDIALLFQLSGQKEYLLAQTQRQMAALQQENKALRQQIAQLQNKNTGKENDQHSADKKQ